MLNNLYVLRIDYLKNKNKIKSEKFSSYVHALGRYIVLKKKGRCCTIYDISNSSYELTENELADMAVAETRLKNDNPVEIVMKTKDGVDMLTYVISRKFGVYLNTKANWGHVLKLGDRDLYKQMEDILFKKTTILYKLNILKDMDPGFLFDVIVFDKYYKDPVKIKLIR